jgi:hypothetical protein
MGVAIQIRWLWGEPASGLQPSHHAHPPAMNPENDARFRSFGRRHDEVEKSFRCFHVLWREDGGASLPR